MKIPAHILKTISPPLTDHANIAWLQLIRSENIGPIIFWELINHYKNPGEILEKQIHHILKKNKKINLCSPDQAEKEYHDHKKKGFHLIPAYDPRFPQALLKFSDCPPVISVYGNLKALNHQSLSIVGARNASLSGRQLSEQFAHDLAAQNWCIVSGMARGIDEMAHRGALKAKSTTVDTPTIAVMAGGVDTPYPQELTNLYHEIAKNGAVISEMPLDTKPIGYLFTRRNRLISGLSRATVVIEAALKSGSLLTAQFALEQNSDIFAVPGSPLDPRCRGSNSLLKQGATLTESASDILTHLDLWKTYPAQFIEPTPQSLQQSVNQPLEKLIESKYINAPHNENQTSDLHTQILNTLSYTPISVNELVDILDLPLDKILSTLVDLEIAGQIERLSYHLVALKPN